MTIPEIMSGVYLKGHGGLEMLEYRDDIPVPKPGLNDVLIRVLAAGVNNTDVNTRTGWYSKSVSSATDAGGADGYDLDDDDGSWTGRPLVFPLIQGADVCGKIVAVGANVSDARIGERVLVRTMQEDRETPGPYRCWTFGSETNGGFAQYTTAHTEESFAINCDWSSVELASIPCAYSTAENALHRAGLSNETILITGASGGVGSAAVQLAKRRGATVIAMTSDSKAEMVRALGADKTVDRNADLVKELGKESVDMIYDLVAGPQWPSFLDVLKRGGRYVTSGAIAGPLVELDVRTLYLKDLTLIGATYQDDITFKNLISYIERGEIKPLVSKTYPLSEIAQAQTDFLEKKFVGKLVLVPPQ